LACALGAAGAAAQVRSDWERENEDRLKQAQEEVVPPPPLERARLVEMKLPAAAETDFRFFVDASSVSVGPDRIVRYVLVARSASGVENVTYEGIRCPAEYRIYAVARADGSWGGRASEWRPIPRDARASQSTLSRQYFCPARQAILSAEEGRKALAAGAHPGVFVEPR
jgi:hypothetical protein